jgi:hypothetical protein
MSESFWVNRDIKVLTENNLIGTMLVCQAFVPPMKAADSGSVVNIASLAAHFGVSLEVTYSTLKAAVVHYPRCLAKELREDGVRVNCVSPGASKTARFQATRVVDPKRMDTSAKSLDRYAEPDEIADAVAFLAGPRAKFINGQVLRVDGGTSLFHDGSRVRPARPAAYTGKKQRIFRNPPLLCKNPHRKRLRIQVFARCAQMNSLRDRTGNQFDHNREFNSR